MEFKKYKIGGPFQSVSEIFSNSATCAKPKNYRKKRKIHCYVDCPLWIGYVHCYVYLNLKNYMSKPPVSTLKENCMLQSSHNLRHHIFKPFL